MAKKFQTERDGQLKFFQDLRIDLELNNKCKDETNTTIYDYPELNTKLIALKTKLATYYENEIQQKLFEYELLK